MDLEFLRQASLVYRSWLSGKKSLRDMTDPDLIMFEEYLRLYLSVLPAGASAPPSPRKRYKLVKKVLLFLLAALTLLILLNSFVRGT